MTRRITMLLMIAAASLVIAAAQPARAATINQLLYDIAAADGVLGQQAAYIFNDADVSTVGTNVAPFDQLSVGDVLVGTFKFNFIGHVGGSNRLIGANSGYVNDALFGRFSLQVTSASSSSISFGPSGAFGSYGMFEVYTAPINTVNSAAADGGYNDPLFATADLYAVIGFDPSLTSEYIFNVTNSVPDLKFATLLSNALDGATIANTSSIKLYVIADGTSDGGEALGNSNVIASIGSFPAGNQVDGSGSIFGTGGPKFDSATAFQLKLTVVPLPAAFASGLALLAVLGFARRIRRAA